MKAASHLAGALIRTEKPENRIAIAYETITSQIPNERETRILTQAHQDLLAAYKKAPELAQKLAGDSEAAALTMVINTIYNLDITKTRQ